MQTNKIIIHAAGGAGCNISVEIMKALSNLGTGFAKVEASYFDTTTKNIDHFPDEISKEQYYLVKDENYGGEVIDGSSGERRMNHAVVGKAIPGYLDFKGINKKENGVYHVVLYSAGGGSGSVIGPLLTKALTSRGIPTISLVIGDSTTGNLAQNTVNTISSIQSLAISIGKPMPIYYLNNATEKQKTIEEKIQSVNRKFITFMTGFSMFVSGENFALDNQDITSMIDFTGLTSIDFPVGAYAIGFYHHEINHGDEEVDTFIGRSLTVGSVSPDTGIELLHWKSGKVVDETVFDIISKEQFPLHLVLTSGKLKNEINNLHDKVKKLRARVESMRPDDTVMDTNASVNDDGLVI